MLSLMYCYLSLKLSTSSVYYYYINLIIYYMFCNLFYYVQYLFVTFSISPMLLYIYIKTTVI